MDMVIIMDIIINYIKYGYFMENGFQLGCGKKIFVLLVFVGKVVCFMVNCFGLFFMFGLWLLIRLRLNLD